MTAPHSSRRRVRRGVIGILSRDGRHLVIRRAPGIARGGHWCFPGGHLDPGETSRRAIQRELLEELGVIATPTKRLGAVRVSDAPYVLAVWRVRFDGTPLRLAPGEVADARWLSTSEIANLEPSLASNRRVLQMILDDDRQTGTAPH